MKLNRLFVSCADRAWIVFDLKFCLRPSVTYVFLQFERLSLFETNISDGYHLFIIP
jgi:hypothetical protein